MDLPVGVEVWRGQRVESRHRVALCLADAAGHIVASVGDGDALVYPRSAIKPFQALALVESGAADAPALGDDLLALACASHGGEPMHVTRVAAWLAGLGLDESALACGPHPPAYAPAAEALIRSDGTPCRLHNNCSGKHTGMLATARHLGWPTAGYEQPDHPLQRLVTANLAAMTGNDALADPAIDGCSLPLHALPLAGMARAAARLADPSREAPLRRAALGRIAGAMRANPEMVAGTGRLCTLVMRTLPDIVVKAGAEGVYLAALPQQGLGLALKIEDGAARAAEPVLLRTLDILGLVPEASREALAAHADPVLVNYAGLPVGRITTVLGRAAS